MKNCKLIQDGKLKKPKQPNHSPSDPAPVKNKYDLVYQENITHRACIPQPVTHMLCFPHFSTSSKFPHLVIWPFPFSVTD